MTQENKTVRITESEKEQNTTKYRALVAELKTLRQCLGYAQPSRHGFKSSTGELRRTQEIRLGSVRGEIQALIETYGINANDSILEALDSNNDKQWSQING